MKKISILAGVAVLALMATSQAFSKQSFAPSSGASAATAGNPASPMILADGRGPGGDSGVNSGGAPDGRGPGGGVPDGRGSGGDSGGGGGGGEGGGTPTPVPGSGAPDGRGNNGGAPDHGRPV